VNALPLGLALVLSGVFFFLQGRLWHRRAAGVRLGSGWRRLPSWLRWVVGTDDDPPAVQALPAQCWGLAALVAGLAMSLGLVESGNDAATIAFLLLVPGALAMGAITLLFRLLPRWRP